MAASSSSSSTDPAIVDVTGKGYDYDFGNISMEQLIFSPTPPPEPAPTAPPPLRRVAPVTAELCPVNHTAITLQLAAYLQRANNAALLARSYENFMDYDGYQHVLQLSGFIWTALKELDDFQSGRFFCEGIREHIEETASLIGRLAHVVTALGDDYIRGHSDQGPTLDVDSQFGVIRRTRSGRYYSIAR